MINRTAPVSSDDSSRGPTVLSALALSHSSLVIAVMTVVTIVIAFAHLLPLVTSIYGRLLLLAGSVGYGIVQFIIARYVSHRREDIHEWIIGEGELASPAAILADLTRFGFLDLTRLSVLTILALSAGLSLFIIPGFFMGTIAILMMIVFIILLGNIGELLSSAGLSLVLTWASLALPAVLLYITFRLSLRTKQVLDRKVNRFLEWRGMAPPRERRSSASQQGAFRRIDSWIDRQLFPPLRLVTPTYVSIIPDDEEEQSALPHHPRCPVCGTPVDGDHIRCSECDSPHHPDCWDYLNRCSTYGCRGTEGITVRLSADDAIIYHTSPDDASPDGTSPDDSSPKRPS